MDFFINFELYWSCLKFHGISSDLDGFQFQRERMESLEMRKAVYGGSFDPLTKGHLWIIERAISLFDELTIVIGVNINKNYFLDIKERQKNIQDCLDFTNFRDSLGSRGSTDSTDSRDSVKSRPSRNCKVNVKIIENQYLAQFALSVNASCLIRGLRCQKDFDYEYAMVQVNRSLAPSVETLYMIPPPHLAHLKSSLVKSLVGSSGWEDIVSSYVPKNVLKSIQERWHSQKGFDGLPGNI